MRAERGENRGGERAGGMREELRGRGDEGRRGETCINIFFPPLLSSLFFLSLLFFSSPSPH